MAQKGRFGSFPQEKLNSQAGPSKMANLSSKRVSARIWPKRAVSAHSHKRNSVAGPGPSKMTNLSSKRLPARIWLKRAVSAHSHKRKSVAGPEPSKMANSHKLPRSCPGDTRSAPEASRNHCRNFPRGSQKLPKALQELPRALVVVKCLQTHLCYFFPIYPVSR